MTTEIQIVNKNNFSSLRSGLFLERQNKKWSLSGLFRRGECRKPPFHAAFETDYYFEPRLSL